MAAEGRRLGTILIADHEVHSRSLAAGVLQKAGYDVVEADNGNDVMDAARRELPRLVILEVTLPGLSGYEVCHQLREEFGDGLPIILVSGERTEPFDQVARILIGADHYMVKPFAPDELLARVRALIRRTHETAPVGLTGDERNLVRLLRQGLGAGEIAERSHETPKSVLDRVDEILTKLGA